jgi:hypothetical protein
VAISAPLDNPHAIIYLSSPAELFVLELPRSIWDVVSGPTHLPSAHDLSPNKWYASLDAVDGCDWRLVQINPDFS